MRRAAQGLFDVGSNTWPLVRETGAVGTMAMALATIGLALGLVAGAPTTPALTKRQIPRVYLIDGAAETAAIALWIAGRELRTLW